MGSVLGADMSRAIQEPAEGGKLKHIENRWFGNPGTCVRRSKDVDARLTLRRFGGLFLTNAAVSCGASCS